MPPSPRTFSSSNYSGSTTLFSSFLSIPNTSSSSSRLSLPARFVLNIDKASDVCCLKPALWPTTRSTSNTRSRHPTSFPEVTTEGINHFEASLSDWAITGSFPCMIAVIMLPILLLSISRVWIPAYALYPWACVAGIQLFYSCRSSWTVVVWIWLVRRTYRGGRYTEPGRVGVVIVAFSVAVFFWFFSASFWRSKA